MYWKRFHGGLSGLWTLPQGDDAVCARFATDQSGVTAIEYGLIAGLITILIIAPATQIGSTVQQFFAAVLAGFNP
jgi:pilus assembly protein Flp/PilA